MRLKKKQARVEMQIDANSLSLYFADINKTPLLSREEEIELAKKMRAGDANARETLLKANLRFVVNIAKKYQNQGLPLSDLISEGNIGLMNALERFDVDRGYHFISYAVWWIRQAVIKAVCEKGRLIRLPLNRVNELMQIEKARGKSNTQSEAQELKEIAESVNMTSAHVRDLLAISREQISLESKAYQDSNASEIRDIIEDKTHIRPEEFAIQKSLKNDINEVLDTLEEKEAGVIRLRFGLSGFTPLSLKEVGVHFGLTKERIRQIEKKALSQLRDSQVNHKLYAYT